MADGSVTLDARLALDQLKKDLKNLKSVMNSSLPSASKALNTLGDGFEKLGNLATSAGKSCGVVTAAVSAFAGYSLKAGASFQAGMSKVQAISGATEAEIEKLTNKAKEMGAKTKFSATESAEAFQYMAMAGWKTGDMLEGIEGLMNLAAASGEDLASVSDIVTDALTAFGLKASDSAHFADVLAKASSNSNTNVGMMGETFKYVAPLAGSMGYSIEDTATAIGLMANAGIKSSQAGTALRSMLTRLVKPPKDAAEALKKLGISAINSDGSMKPLNQTLSDLRIKFAKLDDSQKASFATAIAGQEAMSGLLAIVNASDEDYIKLSESIKNADGSAKQMADTMNNNVSGALTILKSNLEASGIKAFEKVKDSLTELLKTVTEIIPKLDPIFDGVFSQLNSILSNSTEALKKFSDSISNMSDEELRAIGEMIFKVASAGPKLLVIGKAFSIIGGIFNTLSPIVNFLGKSFGFLNTTASGIVEVFKLVSGGAETLNEAIAVVFPKVGSVINVIGSLLKTIGSFAKVAFSAFSKVFQFLAGPAGAIIAGVVMVVAGVITAITSFISMLKNGFSWIKEIIMIVGVTVAAVGAVILGVPAAAAAAVAGIVAAIATAVVVIKDNWNSIKTFFTNMGSSIASFFTETIPSAFSNFMSKLKEFGMTIITSLQNAWNSIVTFFTEGIPNFISSVLEWLSQLPYKIGYQIGLILGHLINFGINAWNWVTVELPAIIQRIIQWFQELPGKIWTFLVDIINKIIEWGINTYNTACEWVTNTINAVTTWFSELPGKIWTFLTDTIAKIQAWGQSAWEKAKMYASNLVNSVVKFFSELPGKIWAKLTDVISKIVAWGTSMVTKGKQAAKNLVDTVYNTLAELPNKVMQIGKNIVEGLWQGIQNAKEWMKNKVGEFANGILDGMKAALDINSPSRVFRDEVGKYIALGVGEGFTRNIASVYKKMKASIDFETQRISTNISATTDLRIAKGNNQNITNNNDNGIQVNNNFYEKVQSPHETARATRNALRRAAYAK